MAATHAAPRTNCHHAMLRLCGVVLDLGLPRRRLPVHFPLNHTLYYSSHLLSLIVSPMKGSVWRTTTPSIPCGAWLCSAQSKYFGLY